MPDENMTPEEARNNFRNRLRELCMDFHELTTNAGLDTGIASQIIAGECMHMSAHFVTHASNFSVDAFLADCRNIYDWHKQRATESKPKPSSLN